MLKSIFNLLFALCFAHFLCAQKVHFAQIVKFDTNVGYAEEFISERDLFWDRQFFWTNEVAVSLNKHLLAGLQARLIRAGTYEVPFDNFFMAGVFGQYNLLGHLNAERGRDFTFFGKLSLLTSNFLPDYSKDVAQFLNRKNTFYMGLEGGGELRIWQGLCLRGGVQFCQSPQHNWNNHGVAFVNAGLSYYLSK